MHIRFGTFAKLQNLLDVFAIDRDKMSQPELPPLI